MKYICLLLLTILIIGCSQAEKPINTTTIATFDTTTIMSLEPTTTIALEPTTTMLKTTTTMTLSNYQPERIESFKYINKGDRLYDCSIIFSDNDRNPTIAEGELTVSIDEDIGSGTHKTTTVLSKKTYQVYEKDFTDDISYPLTIDINDLENQPKGSRIMVRLTFKTADNEFKFERNIIL